MATTMKSWTHPKTGEKRIYINAPGLRAKVWVTFFEPAPGFESTKLHHKEYDLNEYPSLFTYGQGVKPWEGLFMDALAEAGLEDSASFTEILNAIK